VRSLRLHADVLHRPDGHAFQIDRGANLQPGRVLKIRTQGHLAGEQAAGIAGHEEDEDREHGKRYDHDHPDLQLRPLNFLLTGHRRSLRANWEFGRTAALRIPNAGVKSTYLANYDYVSMVG
jgi:hypothetical protein